MLTYRFLILVVALGAAVACRTVEESIPPSPSNAYCQTQDRLTELMSSKEKDKGATALLVAYHYIFCVGKDDIGLEWMEVAGDAGNEEAREFALGLIGRKAKKEESFKIKLTELINRWGGPTEP